MTVQVDVQIAVDDDSIPDAEGISLWIDRTLSADGDNGATEVSVRIVDASEMQELNAEFREQDKSTNVLSFPAGDIVGLPGDSERPLGDIVVCAAVVASEAEQQGKALSDHWAHMLVHGTLHLLGYDHIDDADAVVMEGLEARILGAHGIANPYGESL